MKQHHYGATVRWTGAREGTTSDYRAYSREHEAVVEGKPVLRLSADGVFLGDDALHNAEDLLVIALSGCHLLTADGGWPGRASRTEGGARGHSCRRPRHLNPLLEATGRRGEAAALLRDSSSNLACRTFEICDR